MCILGFKIWDHLICLFRLWHRCYCFQWWDLRKHFQGGLLHYKVPATKIRNNFVMWNMFLDQKICFSSLISRVFIFWWWTVFFEPSSGWIWLHAHVISTANVLVNHIHINRLTCKRHDAILVVIRFCLIALRLLTTDRYRSDGYELP